MVFASFVGNFNFDSFNPNFLFTCAVNFYLMILVVNLYILLVYCYTMLLGYTFPENGGSECMLMINEGFPDFDCHFVCDSATTPRCQAVDTDTLGHFIVSFWRWH